MLLVGWILIVVSDCCCWLLLLVAVADCCCWLLLLVVAVDCCCWLLLLTAFVAADCCCWLLLFITAAGCWKVFEYFRDVGELRLREVCRRKGLWIFSGCWWFAVKTNLQAKKSSDFFGLLVKSLWIFSEYWWEEGGRVSPRGSRVVDGRQRMNKYGCALVIYTQFSKWPPVLARANRIIWWKMESKQVGSVSSRICS